MDLNKHLVTYDTSKPFHNSGFAVVANGDHFGATSNISFDQRQQIDRNRRLISSYQRSSLGNAHSALGARRVVGKRTINRLNIPQRPSLQRVNSMMGSTARHFREPSSRRYDPYS